LWRPHSLRPNPGHCCHCPGPLRPDPLCDRRRVRGTAARSGAARRLRRTQQHEAGWRAPSHHAHGCAVRCARVQEHRGDECSSLSRAEVARELSGRCALGPLPGASASRPTLAASAWRRLWVPRRLNDLDLQSPRPAVVHPESGHRAPRPGRRAATARAWQMVSWRLTFGSPAAPERTERVGAREVGRGTS